VAEDTVEAVRWYRKAAEQGDTDSIRQLVGCYRDGVGAEKDEAEAARWEQRTSDTDSDSDH
jgi:TPR repeat protein